LRHTAFRANFQGMGFTIFPKSAKAKAAAQRSQDLALEPVAADANAGAARGTREGDQLGSALAPSGTEIEVSEDGGLGPSLENAALMFAHGNPAAATAALSHALDTPERKQALVWACLFDLFARAGDRAMFDDLALKFVVQFERSAPAWDEMTGRPAAPTKPANAATGKARALLRGDLNDPTLPAISILLETSKQKSSPAQRMDVDINELNSIDDTCGVLISAALAAIRRRGIFVSFRGLDAAINRLSVPLQPMVPERKGQWYFVLELLQWAGHHEKFEDRAVDFAVTFEISPPSWESISIQQKSIIADAAKADAVPDIGAANDRVVWMGELKGSTDACLKGIAPEAVTTNPVVIDMKGVQRIDFVCGSAIANAFNRLMAQAIDVRVVGASPIIQALLQLTGAPAALFVKA
jgi:anti-anti-sigma regulatory factor